MNIHELLKFLTCYVPIFSNSRISENNKAYHYTNHFDKISEAGHLNGAPINKELDYTQKNIPSIPAKDSKGVVFAYQSIEDAKEEGFGCDILEIEYDKAIITTHKQEADLGAPETVLILCEDIIKYKKV
jgi:hypothetical protein